jgi:hypothetical protein
MNSVLNMVKSALKVLIYGGLWYMINIKLHSCLILVTGSHAESRRKSTRAIRVKFSFSVCQFQSDKHLGKASTTDKMDERVVRKAAKYLEARLDPLAMQLTST